MNNNDIVPGFDDEKRRQSQRFVFKKSIPWKIASPSSLPAISIRITPIFSRNALESAIDAGFIRLIFNCGGLNYVSSTGIGSFTAFLKAVKPRGGDIVLLEIQPKVYEVFQLLGFSQFFNIKDNLEEATAFFRAGEPDYHCLGIPQDLLLSDLQQEAQGREAWALPLLRVQDHPRHRQFGAGLPGLGAIASVTAREEEHDARSQ